MVGAMEVRNVDSPCSSLASLRSRGTAVGAAVLVQSSPAAADAKKLNGAGCFARDGANHLSHSRAEGQYRNTSVADQTVICPITKDVLASTLRVFVRVSVGVNENTCRVFRRNGPTADAAIPPNSVTFFGTTKDVNWTTPIAGNGAYAVECRLPAGLSLFWVQTAEP
jgi:hypothetical protein